MQRSHSAASLSLEVEADAKLVAALVEVLAFNLCRQCQGDT